MKRAIYMLIVLMIFLLMYCGKKKTEYREVEVPEKIIDLGLKLEKSVEIEDTKYNYLYIYEDGIMVQGFKGDSFYILKIYDRDLNKIREVKFGMGQGPGEFVGGGDFCWDGKNFYATDNPKRETMVFDKDFKYIRSIKRAGFLFPLFIKNCKALLFMKKKYPSIDRMRSYMGIYDYETGERRKLFTGPEEVTYKNKLRYLVIGFAEMDVLYREGKIYHIWKKDYSIRVYNERGEIEDAVKVKYERKRKDKSKEKEWISDMFGSKKRDRYVFPEWVMPVSWMIGLDKGFVVIRRRNYSSDCDGYAEGDYFDYNLKPKGKVKLPCFRWIYGLDPGGFTSKKLISSEGGYIYLIKEGEESDYIEKWRYEE